MKKYVTPKELKKAEKRIAEKDRKEDAKMYEKKDKPKRKK